MTAGRQRNLAPQPDGDIRMIIQDAQTRWLRPAEVCEILRNYKQHNFKLNPVPPTTPQSGSLFLFDRKALRYFRKDGHNWRKKKDGKTVREAHERLKAGSVDVLHCYYAHGEDNPSFQRRAYWMLDPAFEHIVLVHYREVTEGNRLCMIRSMHYGTAETTLNAPNPTAVLSQPPPFGHASVNSLTASTSMASPETVEMPGASHSPELEDVDSAEPDEYEEAGADIPVDQSSLQPSLLEQLTDRHQAHPIHQPLGPESWQTGLRNPSNLGAMAGQVNAPFLPPKKEFKPQFSDLQNLSQRAPTISTFARTGDVNSISRQFADILDSPGSSYSLPASAASNALDLSGWTNLLENGRGSGGGNYVKPELSPSPWEEMLTQVTTPHTRRNLLQGAGLTSGLGQSPLGREASQQIGPDVSPKGPKGKGIADALSPRNLGREPQSALEAGLRDVSERILLKEAQEKAQRPRWQATFPDASMVDDASQRIQDQSGAQQMNAMPFGEPDTLGALVRSGHSPKDIANTSKDRLWSQHQQQPQSVQNLINQFEPQNNQSQNNGQQQDQKLQVSLPSPHLNNLGLFDNNSLFSPTIESLLRDVRNDDSSNLDIMESYKKLGSFGKLDSFGRWINTAEDITDIPPMAGSSGSLWDTGYQEDSMSGVTQHMDEGASPSPSLSEHLFNLVDLSPEWGPSTEGTKVIICGSFMPTVNYTDYNWCCMFGETEVPIEILGEGALRCKAPPHKAGSVHLYITRNDRQACSQVRTFEYRSPEVSSNEEMSSTVVTAHSEGEPDAKEELLLKIRLARMLLGHAKPLTNGRIGNKMEIFEDKDNDVWTSLEDLVIYDLRPLTEVKEMLLQETFSHKLTEWLEAKSKLGDGRGPRVLDDRGQGVPHFLAALGYDWSVSTLFSGDGGDDGIPINFRDTAGWTALHWAAKYGREKMVVALLEAGAAPVSSSDPTHKKPRGETAADLASANGHGGIAAFLAEKSLTDRLSGLTLGEKGTIINEIDKMSAELDSEKAVAQLVRRTSIVRSVRQMEDQERLQTSLEAVRSSTHAAALIESAFRQQSLRRRAQLDQGFDEYGLSSAEMQNFVAARKIQMAYRGHHQKKQHLAATRIQQKFRGWKGRKEFVTIRQRIIKLQAHVRGRLVRNHYRKIVWSVSIVEKIVLRWLRKRKGLSGFKPVRQLEPAVDSNEDLIKEGRQMQKDAVQGEVAIVSSMARQKSDREQYTRLREEERRSSANKGEVIEFLASPRDYMDGS